MPIDPSELPEAIRQLTEQNRKLAGTLAPLREGKCPKCLTPLVEGRGPGSRDYPKVCPACGWGRHDDAEPTGGGECGTCGRLV
jgi:hypothetical protein